MFIVDVFVVGIGEGGITGNKLFETQLHGGFAGVGAAGTVGGAAGSVGGTDAGAAAAEFVGALAAFDGVFGDG